METQKTTEASKADSELDNWEISNRSGMCD